MIIPRPNHIIIKPFTDPDWSPSGLIYTGHVKDRDDSGIVKYVGSKCKFVKVGDIVLFQGYSGEELRLTEGDENEKLITMHERLVLAIVGDTTWGATPVNGLYVRDREGNYFSITYEATARFLAESAEEFRSRIRFGHGKRDPLKIDRRPDYEDIEQASNWTDEL